MRPSPGSRRRFSTCAGWITHVLEAIRHVVASLYNDRAISYRVHHGFKRATQRLRSTRCFSRCHSRSRSASRLSCLSLPRASAISTLMRPLA